MIEINQLEKIYKGKKPVVALDRIDLTIGEGMFGLLGPNGAGKTTLMRIMAGIIKPTSGYIKIAGYDLRKEKEKNAVKRILGYLPQELGLYPELTARQFVDYMAILKGLEDHEARKKSVGEILDMVGLSSVADRKLKGYSGGMKRRVGIAQALVNDPKILIVDEPTAGLDPEERIRFRNLLVRLASNRVVIMSTHIVEDIGQTCRDLAVLAEGRILFNGNPLDLMNGAQGKVWNVTLKDQERLDENLTIISMMHLAEGMQYRIVGEKPSEYSNAKLVNPGLEDGYMWLMEEREQVLDQQK